MVGNTLPKESALPIGLIFNSSVRPVIQLGQVGLCHHHKEPARHSIPLSCADSAVCAVALKHTVPIRSFTCGVRHRVIDPTKCIDEFQIWDVSLRVE